jgi:hypothetical protein
MAKSSGSGKTLYRFIGSESLLHRGGVDMALTEYGQKIELTDEEAVINFSNRIPMLPDEELKKTGMTDKEIEAFVKDGTTTAAFLDKRQKAMDAFVQKMMALYTPPPPPDEPAPTAPPESLISDSKGTAAK